MTARLGYTPAENEANLLFKNQIVDNASQSKAAATFCFDYGAFGARAHLENLHPYNGRPGGIRNGVVSFAQRVGDGGNKPWREWTARAGSCAVDEAERLLRQDNRADIYVSQAAFGKWRSISDLQAIGACYADLDYHTVARWRGKAPGDVAAAILGHLEEAMIPHPSYILSTGRGLVCVWLTELLPRTVLPRWNAVQQRIGVVLEPFGADKRALDAARVFRLVGSDNSRAESGRRTVGMVWCYGSPEMPTRHVFGTLADEVLPVTHADLISLRAERAKRKAEGKDNKGPVKFLSAATYWETVLTDLQRLRAYRCPEGALPEGQRDAWLFVAASAMSWISPPEVLGREIIALGYEAAGWRDSETKSRMSAVIKRARQAAAGQTVIFQGREVDCRYRMKANTIIDWLGIDPTEQRAAGLRVLVDEERKRELNTERTKASRHRRGAKDRTAQQAARLEIGQKALYLQASQGMTVAELAVHLGVSVGLVHKAMRQAKQQ